MNLIFWGGVHITPKRGVQVLSLGSRVNDKWESHFDLKSKTIKTIAALSDQVQR